MTTMRVSTFLIEEWLFKGLDAEIRDARMDLGSDVLDLSIRGKDVPDCAEAYLACHIYQEKGCDRWAKVEIRAVQKYPQELGEYAVG